MKGRHRTAEEIRSILDWHRASGLSLLAFARKHGLCYASLRRWRGRPATASGVSPGRGQPQSGGPAFVPVALEVDSLAGDFVLAWAPGRSLRIAAGFDPGQLRRLLAVLGVLP